MTSIAPERHWLGWCITLCTSDFGVEENARTKRSFSHSHIYISFKGCDKEKKMLHDGSNISSITIITKRSWRVASQKNVGDWVADFFCLSSSRIFQIDNTIASSLKRAGKATETSKKKNSTLSVCSWCYGDFMLVVLYDADGIRVYLANKILWFNDVTFWMHFFAGDLVSLVGVFVCFVLKKISYSKECMV